MAIRPRWSDDFSSDPFSDAAYSISSGTDGWSYNGSTKLLENTSGSSSMNATMTLLDSANLTGIVEADLFYSTLNNTSFLSLRAFGYWFVIGQAASSNIVLVIPDSISPGSINSANYNAQSVATKGHSLSGNLQYKIIATPKRVDWYINGILYFSVPKKTSGSDLAINLFKAGATSSGSFSISRILVKSDSSLPSAPTLITPGISGALAATTGPIVTQVPASRLYLDLDLTLTDRIGPGGITNVVFDPGGANISMSEDVGTSDLSGGTSGDYYLECPVRGVSSKYRVTLKDEFVVANSVTAGQSIEFDVVDGPSSQTVMITEEDSLHCFVEKYSAITMSKSPLQSILNPSTNLSLHNVNADGNDAYVNENPPRSRIINAGGGAINNQGRFSFNGAGITLPFIFDIDLGRVRRIRRMLYLFNGSEFNTSVHNAVSFDIYSNTDPFSGASLGQGTLEQNNFEPDFFGISLSTTFGDLDYFQILEGKTDYTNLDITTRYLRLVFNADNFVGGAGNFYIFHKQIIFFESELLGAINSVDDGGQFEFDSGGGYGAFPGGGVTQNGGNVRVTLPSPIEHDGNTPNFYKVYFTQIVP